MAKITGKLLVIIPKANHKTVPIVNNEYIDNEIPLVSFVLMVFIACGKKESVVQNAANKPMIVVMFMVLNDW